jgi:membrane peptidoglycan carboxypeptidase
MTMHGSWDGASTTPLPPGSYGEAPGYGAPSTGPGYGAYGAPGYGPAGDGREPWQPWPGQGGRPRPPRRRRRWRFLRRAVTLLAALAVVAGLVVAGLLLVAPSVANAPDLARRITAAHHAVYPGPAVPRRFAASLVSTEDHRFYSEPGVDPLAVGRVVVGRVAGQPDQGGATLYQQLAKMLYTPGRAGVMVEGEQVLLGIKLSLTFSKPDILRMYADVAYFGHGYYGLPQAACGYFGKQPAQLSWAQASMLAGLVQAPSVYDPLANFAAARARQAHVLGRLRATGTLTAAQAARAYRSRSTWSAARPPGVPRAEGRSAA